MKGFALAKKKTPFQRHKEAEEEKKRKAEEEAAKVYEEFVESFAADEPPPAPEPPKRSAAPASGPRGDHGGSSSRQGSGFGSRQGLADKPKPKAFDDDEEEEPVVVVQKKNDKDKPRQIDLMLERLKQEQQERDEREAARRERGDYRAAPSFEELGMAAGSFDSGDPNTTNLYIGNMAPDVDENVLIKEFGRFGAIGSVKVMWPRDEEQRRKGRNCGFVAFMRREDAARAMDAMDGVVLHDFELRIGWGKTVVLPPIPVWAGPQAGVPLAPMAGQNTPKPGFAPQLALPTAALPTPVISVTGGGHGALKWSSGIERKEKGLHDGVGPDIDVPIIEDLRQRFIIDSLAMYVFKDGCAFEQLIMEEEQGNPEFAFLFDLSSPEHIYYRWRVYSLSEGDSLRTWRIEPFVMVEGGQRWLAPSMTAMSLSAAAAGKAGLGGHTAHERPHHHGSHERPLSDKERDRFEDMLRGMTVERADIRNAMIFALDCADAGADIVETLAEALSLPETPVPAKIARLFLVSDILHNSTVPVRNASRYRSRFEAVLPQIFESLQDTYRAVETRITQEALRRHVLRVLRCWRERFVFGDDFLNGLQATFLLPPMDGAALAAANPGLAAQLAQATDEELERKCRLGGLSTRGGRELQIQRLLAVDAYLNNSTAHGTGPGGDVKPVLSGALGTAISGGTGSGAQAPGDAGVGHGTGAGGHAGPHQGAGEVAVKLETPAVEPKPVAPVSRWTAIDEQEEQAAVPAMPISKWLQEQEAARQQEEAEQQRLAALAAAQAARADEIFPDATGPAPGVDGGAWGPGAAHAAQHGAAQWQSSPFRGAGSAAPTVVDTVPIPGGATAAAAVVDEARRQRLRVLELECARLESELEEQGLSRAEVDARVAARRAQLMADLERGCGGHVGGSARTDSAGAGAGPGSSGVAAPGGAEDREATLGRWKSRREASGSLPQPASESDAAGEDSDRWRAADHGGGQQHGASTASREPSLGHRESSRSERRRSSNSRERDSRDRDRSDRSDRRSSHRSRSRDRGRDSRRSRSRERERSRDRDRSRDRHRGDKKDKADKDREKSRRDKRSRSRSRSRDKEKRSRR